MKKRSVRPEPRTVGELRQLISEQGKTWSVDPRLTDDDPIPIYPRGGQPAEDVEEVTAIQGDTKDLLQQTPPSNPFLRARWVEAGLLPSDDLDVPFSTPRGEDVEAAVSAEEADELEDSQ